MSILVKIKISHCGAICISHTCIWSLERFDHTGKINSLYCTTTLALEICNITTARYTSTKAIRQY